MRVEILIWSISFFITLIVSNLNLKKLFLINLVNKLRRNRNITRIKSKRPVKQDNTILLIQKDNFESILDEEEKEFIILRMYRLAIESMESYKRSLRRKLYKAGVRNDKGLQQSIVTTVILSIVFGTLIYFYTIDQYKEINQILFGRLLVSMFSLIFGFYISSKIIDRFIEKTAEERRNVIEKGIPDLLDLMVICSEAGFDIQKILQRTADEIAISHKTLSDELQRTNAEFKLSSDFYTIFKNLEERTESMKFQSICNIMVQSIEMGSSLTDALKILAHQIRDERSFKAEDLAGKIPNKIMMPLLFFIMPTLFIVILAPMLLKASSAYS